MDPKVINKSVEVFSDNTPTVEVINDAFSCSPNLMHLFHFLMLHCMLNNIKLTGFFIPGDKNDIADSLSYFQLTRFRQLHKEANTNPTPCPTFLCPLSKDTFSNLLL